MRRPTWGLLVAVVASSILSSGLALALALRANAESDRKWCSVVDTLNEVYEGGTQPTTPAGVKLRDGFADLGRDLGC